MSVAFQRALAVLFMGVFVASGCVSKATAKKQAQEAFRAGQQQAINRMQQQQGDVVRINGPVRQTTLPWTPNMTVASALVAADYYGPEPSSILLVRDGRAMRLNTKELLAGRDVQLIAGDVIQVETGSAPPAR